MPVTQHQRKRAVVTVRPDMGVLFGRLDQVHSLQVRMLRDTNHFVSDHV